MRLAQRFIAGKASNHAPSPGGTTDGLERSLRGSGTGCVLPARIHSTEVLGYSHSVPMGRARIEIADGIGSPARVRVRSRASFTPPWRSEAVGQADGWRAG